MSEVFPSIDLILNMRSLSLSLPCLSHSFTCMTCGVSVDFSMAVLDFNHFSFQNRSGQIGHCWSDFLIQLVFFIPLVLM